MGVVVSYFKDETNKVDSSFVKPKVYGNLEGPLYTTLDYNKSYATRHYEASLWVSTIVTGNFDEAWREGLPKLKKYMQGKNQKHWNLPKTCAVTMKKIHHADYNEQVTFMSALTERHKITVSMLISKHFANEAPGPCDPTVFLQEEHKRIFYCGHFKKKFTECTTVDRMETLKGDLQMNGESFDDNCMLLCFYNNAHLRKCEYYECWFYGRKMKEDFRCQNIADSKSDD